MITINLDAFWFLMEMFGLFLTACVVAVIIRNAVHNALHEDQTEWFND
jgi:hypothetical protein